MRPASAWFARCLLVAAVSVPTAARADVVRIDVERRDNAGTHIRFIGRVHFAMDPAASSSRDIADIAFAPRNAAGLVEFSSEFLIFLPRDPARARGTTFFEVVNRGRDQSLGLLSGADQRDLRPDRWQLGDRFVLGEGFALAFLGWQFDVAPRDGLTFQAPIAPVDGLVRATHIGRGSDVTFPLKYCAADANEQGASLTVRAALDDNGIERPRTAWRFANGGCAVDIDAGAPPGLYEVVYRAHGSPMAGLGLAAVRDFTSFLKYGGPASLLGDGTPITPRVIGFGYSQGGRFLRQFLRDGFNRDTQGRRVFDGVLIASAGAGVGSFNHRFASPGDAGNSVLSILRPVDLPPFTDDELFSRPVVDNVVPKVMSTVSSTEYWARAASLTHTDETGTRDVPLPATSRLYLLGGTPHAAGPVTVARPSTHAHALNFADQRWTLRALVLALDAWITNGTAPPPSRYPTIAAGTLVARTDVKFPLVPAMPFPAYMPRVWRLDYGADFAPSRVITKERPALGAPFRLLVPQVSEDGNDLGGIVLPEVAVPLGTFTGWNARLPALPALDYLAGLVGAFAPFEPSRRARQRSGDARASIEERYSGRGDYLRRVERAARDLVVQGFMLARDVRAVVTRAEAMWSAVVEVGP